MANKTLKEALQDGVNVDGMVTTGVTPIYMNDYVWDDILGYSLARSLDASRGHIDYNFDEGTTDFDDSATITNTNDALIINYQLPHSCYRGTGAVLKPHVHWLQENSGSPYQKVEYRICSLGSAPTTWTAMDASNFTKAFTYVSGVLTQLTSFEDIDISSCGLSCVVQLRIWRDGQNVLDTYGTGKVKMLFMDAHFPKAYLGSKDEFVQ